MEDWGPRKVAGAVIRVASSVVIGTTSSTAVKIASGISGGSYRHCYRYYYRCY